MGSKILNHFSIQNQLKKMEHQREILSIVVDENSELLSSQATLSSTCSPFTHLTPASTRGMSLYPISLLQPLSASRQSLKTIASVAFRVPEPLVRRWRSRTVAKVGSVGLAVRRWNQRTAGKS